MKTPRAKFVLLAAVVALAACAVSAQVPVQNIDPERHGNRDCPPPWTHGGYLDTGSGYP